MKNIGIFLDQSSEIVQVFNEFVTKYSLQDFVSVDHICFKCDSGESFEEWRKVFEREGKNLYQAIISKRRIATITFKNPINTLAGQINYLELSDQKPDNSQTEGFDHIEFYPKSKSLEEVLEIFESREVSFIKDVKPHITQYIIEVGKYNFRLASERLVDKIKKEEFI